MMSNSEIFTLWCYTPGIGSDPLPCLPASHAFRKVRLGAQVTTNRSLSGGHYGILGIHVHWPNPLPGYSLGGNHRGVYGTDDLAHAVDEPRRRPDIPQQ